MRFTPLSAAAKCPRRQAPQTFFAQISAATLSYNVDQEKIARFKSCCNLIFSNENIDEDVVALFNSYARKYAQAQCPAKMSYL